MKDNNLKTKKHLQQSNIKTFNTLNVSTITTFVVMYAIVCLSIVTKATKTQNFVTNVINLSDTLMLVFFAVLFLVCIISFLIIEKQGANKKTKIYYYLLGTSLTINIVLFYTLSLIWASLFVSALSLFFSLLLLHELKKTNKKAYHLNLFVCLLCLYLVVNFYVISLIN